MEISNTRFAKCLSHNDSEINNKFPQDYGLVETVVLRSLP